MPDRFPQHRRSRAERPYVLLNLAMTADGKIATANRALASFGSPSDQEHLYALRSTVDAVMTGAGTVAAEDVDLGPGPLRFRQWRRQRGLAEANLRIVVTATGRLRPTARIFREGLSPLVVVTCARVSARRLRQLRKSADAVGVFGRGEVDFRAAFRWLRRQWGVRRLLCEGGGELNGFLWRAGLVDEVHLTVCPKVFGGRTAPTIADGPNPASLAEGRVCRLRSRRRAGDELFLVYDVLPPMSSALRARSQSRSPSRLR